MVAEVGLLLKAAYIPTNSILTIVLEDMEVASICLEEPEIFIYLLKVVKDHFQ